MEPVKALGRVLALGLLPLGLSLGLGALASHPTPPAPLQVGLPPGRACTQPPVFVPGYQRGENYVISQGQGFKFRSEAWLQADLCSAGTLTITADGALAGDGWPQLTVALDSTVLAAPGFSGPRTSTLRVPAAGRLYLAYLNDYYLADVRVANLRNITLSALTCQGFKRVDMPKAGGGVWTPQASAATLIGAVPMTLTPCAAGTLSLAVRGREAQGAFPVLVFQQGGRILETLSSTLDKQDLRLDLSATPLTITLTNPYRETLADRNLNVRRLVFRPDPVRQP
ncbi:hypothetical protein [Deinococcus frigens]|uniref:hypothetical protein n=1 Tax=Deinococcus frigens TaxID=249403 RepID=UPI000497E903|nr:hypothetical protein [Deinococcus frigens]